MADVRINEIMVANTATLADETGAFPPWLELFNTSTLPVDLSGVALSDDRLQPGKWRFPAGAVSRVPAGGRLVVFCDGRPSTDATLHAAFSLGAGPLEVILNDGSDLFFADATALGADRSLGRFPDGEDRIFALEVPTPGAANAAPNVQGGATRGDVDRNGELDLGDAIAILAHLFLGADAPYCEPVADADGDGVVNLADPERILAHLFRGAEPLPLLTEEETAECAGNAPPVVIPRPVYPTYPGHAAEFPIGATDPDGDRLRYEAVDLPPGASLDGETGLVRWTPGEDQLGPFYLTFAVSDEADPPHRVGGRIAFQVHPLDACVRPRCDPAAGCEADLAPIAEPCCGEPGARLPEPDVGCPEGRSIGVGRNPSSAATIGRLVNCDLLRLVPLGQGGHVARLSVETRCLAPEGVFLEARLETSGVVLFEESAVRDLEAVGDGLSRLRNLRFVAEGPFANGDEAQLTVSATDTTGVTVSRTLRLVITRETVPDLP